MATVERQALDIQEALGSALVRYILPLGIGNDQVLQVI